MPKRIKLILSLFGIFLSIIGFYVTNASTFPLIQRIISPSYVNAKAAIDNIRKDGAINAGSEGFAALAKIIESRISEQNPLIARSLITLERLEAVGGGISFGQSTSRQTVLLKMHLRGQIEALEWDLLELSTVVEDIWESRSISWAIWLFWVGVFQTIWPLFVQSNDMETQTKQTKDAA